MKKTAPQIMESHGAALAKNAPASATDDGQLTPVMISTLRGDDFDDREWLSGDGDLDAQRHRLLQGTLLAEIGAAVIPIIVNAVAEVIIAAIPVGDGLAADLTSAIVLAVAGVIAAAIVDAIFGGGGQLQGFVATAFNQNLQNSSGSKRKFKLFKKKPKVTLGNTAVGAKFAQLLTNAIDDVKMPGLPKLKLPIENSAVSVQLLSTTMSSLNMTMDVSSVDATALGEAMLAVIASLPK
jgi:hypothetical protein